MADGEADRAEAGVAEVLEAVVEALGDSAAGAAAVVEQEVAGKLFET